MQQSVGRLGILKIKSQTNYTNIVQTAKAIGDDGFSDVEEKELTKNGYREMARAELDDVITSVDIESNDRKEDKASVTYKKLKELLKKARELSYITMEIVTSEERRGHFIRGVDKLCVPYVET
ncbi:hypothetical protein AVEN_42875-1 [Araneus ventricosus]|uniref:Uncharacterized protein n=1 Tax=Araneus ventricosus TaxID=182803 RepID=A0A4Y2AGA6_ARAVE|nr:hypothetical protein AVEN_42875-1 [Araneus ventricosus]